MAMSSYSSFIVESDVKDADEKIDVTAKKAKNAMMTHSCSSTLLDLGSYLLGHLLDTSKAQRLVACMHASG